MIGDWVRNDFGESQQIVDIRQDCVMLAYNDTFSLGKIEPIPLTPEILEKNGFEFGYTTSEEEFCHAVGCGYPAEKGWCYDEGAGEIKIIFPNENDGGLIRLDDQCADKHLELIFVKPIMVHELQHCLKLVGIDKTIEL